MLVCMCQRLSEHPKLGVHSMTAVLGLIGLTALQIASPHSTDAASWMPTAMHPPLRPRPLLLPLPHLKASSASCRWEWSKHAEGHEDLRGTAVEQ